MNNTDQYIITCPDRGFYVSATAGLYEFSHESPAKKPWLFNELEDARYMCQNMNGHLILQVSFTSPDYRVIGIFTGPGQPAITATTIQSFEGKFFSSKLLHKQIVNKEL